MPSSIADPNAHSLPPIHEQFKAKLTLSNDNADRGDPVPPITQGPALQSSKSSALGDNAALLASTHTDSIRSAPLASRHANLSDAHRTSGNIFTNAAPLASTYANSRDSPFNNDANRTEPVSSSPSGADDAYWASGNTIDDPEPLVSSHGKSVAPNHHHLDQGHSPTHQGPGNSSKAPNDASPSDTVFDAASAASHKNVLLAISIHSTHNRSDFEPHTSSHNLLSQEYETSSNYSDVAPTHVSSVTALDVQPTRFGENGLQDGQVSPTINSHHNGALAVPNR